MLRSGLVGLGARTPVVANRLISFSKAGRLPPAFARGYADMTEDRLSLTLACPHSTPINGEKVKMVTLPAASGEMGVHPYHIPMVTELVPGTVSVVGSDRGDAEYFVSGGFATIKDTTCDINAVEAVPLDQLDPQAVKQALEEYKHKYATAKDDNEKALASIGLEVYEAMAFALKQLSAGSNATLTNYLQ
ncbi:ATP synthase F1 subunit delta [Balamuthia mandrillaris]